MSMPAVAVSGDGKRFAAAWKDVRAGSPRVWWAQGAEPRLEKEAAVAKEGGEQDHPRIAFDARGVAWVAWEEGRRTEARVRLRALGREGSPIDVTGASQGTPAFPVLATGPAFVVVAWETSGDGGDRVFATVVSTPP